MGNTTQESTHAAIDRRTIAKAGAWSIPAIATMSAVPARASSLVCDPDDPIINGLASVTVVDYPSGPAKSNWNQGGVSVVLQQNGSYTWTYRVELLDPGLAESLGDFGVMGWAHMTVTEVTCDSALISVGMPPAGYERMYRRLTLLQDVPAGYTFTVTVTVSTPSFSSQNSYFYPNAWWRGVNKNVDCADATAPAAVRRRDDGNVLETGPTSGYGDPTLVFFVQ